MRSLVLLRQQLWRRLLPTLFALMLALNMPLTGYAAITPCRGDPIVETTYHRIQSVVEVYTDISNIDRVEYIYRVPLGKTLPVLYDSSPLAAKERATFVASGGAGVQIDTIVYLKPGVAPVQVNVITTITSKTTGNSITKTITGMSGQTISISNR